MAKDKDKAKALQKAKAAQEAAEKARKMFPNGKKGQKPSPHHPRPGGKRGSLAIATQILHADSSLYMLAYAHVKSFIHLFCRCTRTL